MSIEKKVAKIINEVNPKLGRLAGARMFLIKVNDITAEVFIKIEAKNSC